MLSQKFALDCRRNTFFMGKLTKRRHFFWRLPLQKLLFALEIKFLKSWSSNNLGVHEHSLGRCIFPLFTPMIRISNVGGFFSLFGKNALAEASLYIYSLALFNFSLINILNSNIILVKNGHRTKIALFQRFIY